MTHNQQSCQSGKPSTTKPAKFVAAVDSRPKSVPCSIYISGIDWYTNPCYRFFTGPRPTFLAAILLNRALAYAAERAKEPPKNYSTYAICQTCNYGYTARDSCQTPTCRNFLEHQSTPKFSSAELITALEAVCEEPPTADTLPPKCSAHRACNTAPHFRFAVADDGKVTAALAGVAGAPEPVVVTAEQLLRACLVEDDKNGLKLDELMAVYVDKTGGKKGGGEDASSDGTTV
ncbi:hypothetical protein HK405_012773 [Cladochytrium tenue]|nr:hypothetical protein HK405_012773 [Cladochytrium tenue]